MRKGKAVPVMFPHKPDRPVSDCEPFHTPGCYMGLQTACVHVCMRVCPKNCLCLVEEMKGARTVRVQIEQVGRCVALSACLSCLGPQCSVHVCTMLILMSLHTLLCVLDSCVLLVCCVLLIACLPVLLPHVRCAGREGED